MSLDVASGECVALVGESGSGKTTLLRCFNRLVEPDAGSVYVDDVDVRTADAVALRRRIGYVPQDGGLMPHWTVRRNVELVPWLHGAPNADAGATRRARARRASPTAAFGARYPRSSPAASGSASRWRARSPRSPTVLLLDEPFGALDAITRAELQEMFAPSSTPAPVTCVLVTHDLLEAQRLADRIAVMRAGRIEQIGDAATIIEYAGDRRTSRGSSRRPGCERLGRGAASMTPVVRARARRSRWRRPRRAHAPVVVASKPFGESYLLGEMFAQLLEARGFRVDRRPGSARPRSRSRRCARTPIDVYPEYTGTGLLAILGDTTRRDAARRRSRTSRPSSAAGSACAGFRRSASRTPTRSACGARRRRDTHCAR